MRVDGQMIPIATPAASSATSCASCAPATPSFKDALNYSTAGESGMTAAVASRTGTGAGAGATRSNAGSLEQTHAAADDARADGESVPAAESMPVTNAGAGDKSKAGSGNGSASSRMSGRAASANACGPSAKQSAGGIQAGGLPGHKAETNLVVANARVNASPKASTQTHTGVVSGLASARAPALPLAIPANLTASTALPALAPAALPVAMSASVSKAVARASGDSTNEISVNVPSPAAADASTLSVALGSNERVAGLHAGPAIVTSAVAQSSPPAMTGFGSPTNSPGENILEKPTRPVVSAGEHAAITSDARANGLPGAVFVSHVYAGDAVVGRDTPAGAAQISTLQSQGAGPGAELVGNVPGNVPTLSAAAGVATALSSGSLPVPNFVPTSVPTSVPPPVPTSVPTSVPAAAPLSVQTSVTSDPPVISVPGSATPSVGNPVPSLFSGSLAAPLPQRTGTHSLPVPESVRVAVSSSAESAEYARGAVKAGLVGEAANAEMRGNAVSEPVIPRAALAGASRPGVDAAPRESAPLPANVGTSFSSPVSSPPDAIPSRVVPDLAPTAAAKVAGVASGFELESSEIRGLNVADAAPIAQSPPAAPKESKQGAPSNSDAPKTIISSLVESMSVVRKAASAPVASTGQTPAEGTDGTVAERNDPAAAAPPAILGGDAAAITNAPTNNPAGSTNPMAGAAPTVNANASSSGRGDAADAKSGSGVVQGSPASAEAPGPGIDSEKSPASNGPAAAAQTSMGHEGAGGGSVAPPATPVPVANPSFSPSSSPALERPGTAAELPSAHQALDSAPIASPNEPAAMRGAQLPADSPGSDAAVLQMHMGVHTSAFGNVEIHTVVEQSQVGVSIHGDREVARWFNSEVGGLEAGLKSQHLNLTGVDFSSNRSGVQTATSFQQGQPRQNFSQNPGTNGGALPANAAKAESEPETETETETVSVALSSGLKGTRVSILV